MWIIVLCLVYIKLCIRISEHQNLIIIFYWYCILFLTFFFLINQMPLRKYFMKKHFNYIQNKMYSFYATNSGIRVFLKFLRNNCFLTNIYIFKLYYYWRLQNKFYNTTCKGFSFYQNQFYYKSLTAFKYWVFFIVKLFKVCEKIIIYKIIPWIIFIFIIFTRDFFTDNKFK